MTSAGRLERRPNDIRPRKMRLKWGCMTCPKNAAMRPGERPDRQWVIGGLRRSFAEGGKSDENHRTRHRQTARTWRTCYHMRLMTLLQELVRDKGFKGAARVLELDQRTVAECARTGQLSRRVRQALERALQEGVGSAAARQRERNDKLESRVEALEKGREAHGKGPRRVGQGVAQANGCRRGPGGSTEERDEAQGTGAGHAGAGPSQAESRCFRTHGKEDLRRGPGSGGSTPTW